MNETGGRMSRYILKVWTGPCAVKEIATKMREAGVEIKVEGTEHLYVWSEGSDRAGAAWNLLVDLVRKHGTDFGLSPQYHADGGNGIYPRG